MADARSRLDQRAIELHANQSTQPTSELLGLMEPVARRAVLAITQGDHADDIVQEALFRAGYRFSQWDPKRGRCSTWVAVISRSVAIDYLRRESRAPVPFENPPDWDDEETVSSISAIDDRDLIRSLFDHLKAQRDISAIRVLTAIRNLAPTGEAITYEVIADRAEVSVSTVRRTLPRLRAWFDDQI